MSVGSLIGGFLIMLGLVGVAESIDKFTAAYTKAHTPYSLEELLR